MKLCTTVFNTIGYSENEPYGPRTRPEFTAESSRFRVQLRKIQFVNPNANNRTFQTFNGEWTLSEEMKRFTEIACTKQTELLRRY